MLPLDPHSVCMCDSIACECAKPCCVCMKPVYDVCGLWEHALSVLLGRDGVVLTRSVWAGAARLGVVLWSSDIFSTFEELTAQVKIGVGATISGIPWWTTDVGGFGCPVSPYNNTSPYMQELIVRWYQFGVVSPVFRTHGCRAGAAEVLPASSPCMHAQGMKPQGPQGSCGFNEVWSYGPAVEPVLTALVRFRNDVLAPYILALGRNVSLHGVPTMRPLWYDFPRDDAATDPACDDQFMLGPLYMAAPVTTHGASSRSVYFPGDASVGWEEVAEVRMHRLFCARPCDSQHFSHVQLVHFS